MRDRLLKLRRQQMRRPLPMRVFALFMAVVMVISVITVTNPRLAVKAAAKYLTADTALVEDVKNINSGTYTVNVPAKGAYVLLSNSYDQPAQEIIQFTTVFKKGASAPDSAPKYVSVNTEGYEQYIFNVNITPTKQWLIDGTAAPNGDFQNVGTYQYVSSAESSKVAKLTTKYDFSATGTRIYQYDEGVGSNVDIVDSELVAFLNAYYYANTDVSATITVNTYQINDAVGSLDNSTKEYTVTDSDYSTHFASSAAQDGVIEVGGIFYTMKKDNGELTTYTTLDSLNSALNADTGDATYTVKRYVSLRTGEVSAIDGSEQDLSFTRNFVLLTGFSVLPEDGTKIEGVMTNTPHAVEVPVLAVNKKATVSFSTDVTLDVTSSTAITVKKGTEDVTGLTITKAEGTNDYSFDIAAPGDSAKGTSPVYTVTLNDGEITDSFDLKINYDDGTPSISEIKVAGKDKATDGNYYVVDSDLTGDPKAASIDITGTITPAASLSKIESATIGSKVAGVTEGTSTVSSTLEGLTPGSNSIDVFLTSTYHLDSASQTIDVFYDASAPTISSISLNQDLSAGGLNNNSSTGTITDNSITFGKVSNGAATRPELSFTVSEIAGKDASDNDVAGSGIVSVTINGETATASSGTYTYEVPADATSIPIVLTDKAGNSRTYTANIAYFNETVTINGPYYINADNELEKYVTGTTSFIKWRHDIETGSSYDLTTGTGARELKIKFTVSNPEAGLNNVEVHYSVIAGTAAKQFNKATIEAMTAEEGVYTFITEPISFANSDQLYNVYVVAKDNNGVITQNAVNNIYIDSSNPTETLQGTWSATTWYKQPLTINVDVADAAESESGLNASGLYTVVGNSGLSNTKTEGGVFSGEVDQSTKDADTGTVIPTTVKYTVYDNVGNSVSKTINLLVDGTDPVSNLSIVADGTEYYDGDNTKVASLKSVPIITFNPQDALSGIDNTDANKPTLYIQKNAEAAVEISTGIPSTYFDGADASDVFVVTATLQDLAKNQVIDTKSFKIDGGAPVNNLLITSPNPKFFANYKSTYSNVVSHFTIEEYYYGQFYNSSVAITASSYDKNLATVSYTDTTESGSTTTAIDVTAGEATATEDITISGDGKHTVIMTSTDTSGNASSDATDASKYLTFTIDTKAPGVKFYLNDTENYTASNSYVQSAKVGLTIDETNLHSIEFKITKPDGSTDTQTTAGPFNYTADGKYTVSYTVYDKAGNETTVSGIGFTVDSTKPNPISAEPTTTPTKSVNYYYNSDIAVKLTITDVNLDSSKTKVTDSFDNTSYSPSWTKSGDTYTATITIPKSQEGSHRITVEATDLAGNTNSADSVLMVIDTTNPVLSTTLDDAAYSVSSSDSEGYKYAEGSAKVGVSVSDTNPDYTDMKATITRNVPSGGTKSDVKNGSDAYSFTLTDDGAYTVEFSYKDKAGNPASATIAFTIDNGKPVNNLHITSSAPAKASKYSNTYTNEVGRFTYENYSYGKYFNDSVTLDVSAFDYNIDSAYVTDNGEFVADLIVNGNYAGNSITIKNEGTHEVKVISKDKSGNVSSDSGSQLITFTIDRTKPSLTTYLNGLSYSELNTYVGSDCSTKVSVRDTNEDEDDVSVSITKTPTGGSASTTTGVGKGDYIMSGDGTYTVTYTATDRAGNTSTASFGVTIDKTAPVTNLYVTTANPSKVDAYSWGYSNVVNRFHDFSDQEEYTYGQYYNSNVTVDLGYYDYNIDYVTVTDNGQEISPTWVTSTPLGHATATITGDGYHDIVIYVKDLAGNESPDYGSEYKRVYFTIDTIRPTITASVNNAVDGGAMRYLNTNADVNVYVTDTNKDTNDLYKTVRMTPPGSGVSITNEYINEGTESFTQEADYEITYIATDLAGNVSDSKVVQFRVDKTAPNLSISTVQGDSSNSDSVSLSFNMVESFYSDMVLANVKIYRTVDGQARTLEANIDLNPTSANFSYPYTFTTDATYEIEFTAEDKCGNKSETKYTFIKDGTAPLIVLSGVGNYDKTDGSVELSIVITEAFYLSNNVKLTGTRTDIDGVAHDIDFEVFPSTSGVTSELKHLFEEDGIYDITVTSTDKVGNTTTSTVHFTIDTTAPEIGDLSKYKDAKLKEFVWDLDENELVKDLTVCDVKIYIDGVEYDGTTVLSDGTHVLRVEATDELDHKSVEEVSFIIDTIAPNIIVTNVEEGDNLLEATDITVSVQIDEDTLDWVKLNGEEISVNENQAKFNVNSKGKYTITAGAYDDAGNGATMELNFTFGKKTNWLLIICCGGGLLILLALIILLIAKRRRDNY